MAVLCLFSSLHGRIAVLYANEGNERGDSMQAYEELYAESIHHREILREVLKDRGLEIGMLAHNNELELAVVLYNWAYSL